MKRLEPELLKKNIEAAASYDLEENNVFGSAYFVSQNGETLFSQGFGVASLEKGTPVDDRTLFRLASMTKPVTAVAVLVLVRDGLIRLSDPVSEYIPEFAELRITRVADGKTEDIGAAKNAVTVQDLLTHTSGFGCAAEKHEMMTPGDKVSAEATVKYFARAGLDFEPRSTQAYSPIAAFDAAVVICDRVTGRDHLEFVKKEIFEPCGMADTTYILSKQQQGRLSDMHGKADGRSITLSAPEECSFGDFPQTHYLGGGGLVSSLYDYSRFAEMLLRKGLGERGRVLPEKLAELLSAPSVPQEIMGGSERWGLGVRVIVKDSYGRLPTGSFGWSGAYGTHFWVDPKNAVAAVFMKNSGFDGGAGNASANRFESAVNTSFEE